MPTPHVFVIAPNRVWFEGWCRADNNPQENPRDPKFLVWSGPESLRRGRGYQVTDADKLIILGHGASDWGYYYVTIRSGGRERKEIRTYHADIIGIMLTVGFRQYEDGFGNVRDLAGLIK